MKKLMLSLVLIALTGTMFADQTKTDATDRLDSSAKVLKQINAAPDKGIPQEVMDGAKCVAVVPRLIKGAFIIGGKHGRGVATCRLPNGKWSAPAFFSISGGSWGAQIGAESVDLVMMIMNDNGMRHLLSNKFQIGGEAAAAAGPVGRHAAAGTDWKLDSQILTYSRAHGAFAGVSLDGSWIEKDDDSTEAFYGKQLTNEALLEGKVTPPAAANPFLAAVKTSKAVANKRG